MSFLCVLVDARLGRREQSSSIKQSTTKPVNRNTVNAVDNEHVISSVVPHAPPSNSHIEFQKQRKQALLDVDVSKLSGLLCPYYGSIQSVPLKSGMLYLSDLASYESAQGSHKCLIPKHSQKNPQSSWLSVEGDARGLVFRTDPLGTFPLWYLVDGPRLIITSEVKSLLALVDQADVTLDKSALNWKGPRPINFGPYSRIQRVKPGAELLVGNDLSIEIEGGAPLDTTPSMPYECPETATQQLARILEQSAREIGCRDRYCATLLSGGIGSSIATSLMASGCRDVQTYMLGTSYGNASTETQALLQHFALNHHKVFADEDLVREHFERVVFCNELVDGSAAELLAKLSILSESARLDVSKVVTGLGSSMLFGPLDQAVVTDLPSLQDRIDAHSATGLFAPFFAWSLGIEMHHLFWEPKTLNLAFRLSKDLDFGDERTLLDKLAEDKKYLPNSIASRGRVGFRGYGAQFSRVLSEAQGLVDKYSYAAKDRLCINQLRDLLSSTG